MATVFQCYVTMSSFCSQLKSIGKSWGVNGHTTQCTSPYQWSHSFGWCLAEG